MRNIAKTASVIVFMALGIISFAQSKPNIVLFVADDLHRFDIGVYGAVNCKTPNIDKLASEGIRMDQAYTAFSQCSPCRAELYTGLFPRRNGVIGNGIPANSDVKGLPLQLRPLGYRVCLTGKKHVGPSEVFPFGRVGQRKIKVGQRKIHEVVESDANLKAIRDYIEEDKEKPFCLVVGSHQPHLPWDKGDPSVFDPDKFVIQPNHWDNKHTREVLCKYYAEVEYLDMQVGKIRKLVKDIGIKDNTVFIFLSEHGAHLPGAKFTGYQPGIHAGMIAKWKGRIKPGSSSDAIVHYADILPTLMEIAGGTPPEDLDGSSILKVWEGKKDKHRDYAHSFITSALPHSTVGGYPIRAVTDTRFKLVRNYWPEKTFSFPGMGRMLKSWQADAETDPAAKKVVDGYKHHPSVEFYDLAKDPWEQNNVADNPEYKKELDRLQAELDRWLKQQGDDPSKTEKEAIAGRNAKRVRAGKSKMWGGAD